LQEKDEAQNIKQVYAILMGFNAESTHKGSKKIKKNINVEK